jgi:hypothetical protein
MGFLPPWTNQGQKYRRLAMSILCFFTPPSVNDKQWFGDCAADALLTVKALHGIQADVDGRVEDYTFGFHGAGFTATHYRVYAGADRIPMDHSEFYANLNMEYAEQDVTEIDPGLELIGDIGVGDGSRNFAEFRDGDNLYLATFTVREMEERPDDILISSSVFEQDLEGIVRRQIQVSNFVPKTINKQYVNPPFFGTGCLRVGEHRWRVAF